jgi:hypothetical protein
MAAGTVTSQAEDLKKVNLKKIKYATYLEARTGICFTPRSTWFSFPEGDRSQAISHN